MRIVSYSIHVPYIKGHSGKACKVQWDPMKRLTVSTQPSELLECHLIWISDHVSCCKGNLLDMQAGIYLAFAGKSVPDSCLCAPKSAASGILVLGMKGWIMERSSALVSHGAPDKKQT